MKQTERKKGKYSKREEYKSVGAKKKKTIRIRVTHSLPFFSTIQVGFHPKVHNNFQVSNSLVVTHHPSAQKYCSILGELTVRIARQVAEGRVSLHEPKQGEILDEVYQHPFG
jgi:hypothetical protein